MHIFVGKGLWTYRGMITAIWFFFSRLAQLKPTVAESKIMRCLQDPDPAAGGPDPNSLEKQLRVDLVNFNIDQVKPSSSSRALFPSSASESP